jgi:hypothetical protein
MRTGIKLLLGAATCLACFPQGARAHIIMEGELKGREGEQKTAPCEGKPRSARPYRFEPGAGVELAAMEAIPHDGYFRISFDDDGTDFVDPASIAPINPDRYGPAKPCLGTADDRCGQSDFCSHPTVLWDQLDPHLGTDVTLGQVRRWTVQLPNIECDRCTIQVMQVMEDPADGAHGPFDGKDDLYYRCIDVELKKGAGNTPGTASGPAENDGIECAKGVSRPAEPLPPRGPGDAGSAPDAHAAASDASADASGRPVEADDHGSGHAAQDGGARVAVDAADDDERADDGADDRGCSVTAGSGTTGSRASSLLLAIGAALFLRRRRVGARAGERRVRAPYFVRPGRSHSGELGSSMQR